MTLTASQAVDEIRTLFYTRWHAEAPGIVGNEYLPEVRFKDDGGDGTLPDRSQIWCRLSVLNIIESQSTLNNNDGRMGGKRWRTDGRTVVQIFIPKTHADVLRGEALANLAKLAFRGQSTPGGVWFRNVTAVPLGPELQYYRYNVVAEHNYDEQD